MRVPCAVAIIGILLATPAAPPVSAQELGRRPSAAVFGAPDPRLADDPPEATLSATGLLFGAYDDSLFLDQRAGTLLPPSRSRGSHLGFGGTLLYERAGDQSVRASLSGTNFYHLSTHRLTPGHLAADVSSSSVMPLWRGARLRSSGMAHYARYGVPFVAAASFVGRFPADMFYGDDDIHLRRTDVLRGQAQLEQDWGARKSVGVIASVQTSGLEGSGRAEGYELGGLFSNRFGRNGTLRAGYTLQEIDYGGGATYLIHHLNLGGNYGRPLSATRRVYLSFSGGSTVLESHGQARLQAVGDAALQYEIGRTWRGSARYRRGVVFVDEIAGPLLSDGFSAEIDGLLSRRLELRGSGSFTRGTAGLSRDAAPPYDMYLARTQARYALSRVAAIYAEYLFFKYRFAESVQLGGALPSYYDRHTVRAGVTVLTQLLR